MGELIAVLNKKGKDATKTAITMLEALAPRKSDAFSIASPSTSKTERTLETLKDATLNSPIIIGQLFTRILPQDNPQPIRLNNATLIMEGRTHPTVQQILRTHAMQETLRSNEALAKTLIRKTEGSFIFAIAEPDKLLCGRDPLGVQPLYYGENTDYTALASERKALRKIGITTAESFPPGNIATLTKHGTKLKPVKTLTHSKPEQVTLQKAAIELQKLLQHSVREKVAELKEVAVAFSGGLDSSLIAHLTKNTGTDVQLVHVSLEKQTETEHAKKAAEELKLPLHVKLYKETDVEKILPKVLWLIEEPDPLKASIGIPFYWIAENASAMNTKVLFAGQGADELFGGYKRYVREYQQNGEEKLRKTMFNDLFALHATNLERDSKICSFHGVELRLPFLTWKTATFALKLSTELKIGLPNAKNRKLILRQTAKNMGLTKLIADKPKKAMQYATGVNKTLEKIAKKEGLTLREYLERKFQTTKEKEPQK